MEVMRSEEPSDQFLEKVRKLSTDNNIVLIFDECTSGFRETFGGLHIKYKVKPDLAMFGKAHILLPGRSKKLRCGKCGQLKIGKSCGCS